MNRLERSRSRICSPSSSWGRLHYVTTDRADHAEAGVEHRPQPGILLNSAVDRHANAATHREPIELQAKSSALVGRAALFYLGVSDLQQGCVAEAISSFTSVLNEPGSIYEEDS